MIRTLQNVRTIQTPGALYSVIPEESGNFLLGLGLWDRENAPHSQEVKNQTPGQVVRVNQAGEIIASSPLLDNIIYQLQPIETGIILVGCRNSNFYFLNEDLSINRKLDLPGNGLYFWNWHKPILTATMRAGALMFLDLRDNSFEILQIVDPEVRMWALASDPQQIVCGSYNGDLALVRNRQLVKKIAVSPTRRNAVWAIEHWQDGYFVGTASGEIFYFNRELEEQSLLHQNQAGGRNSGITSVMKLGDQLLFGDLHGNLHLFNPDGSVIDFDLALPDKTTNTIWWLAPDVSAGQVLAAHCNGSLDTYQLK
jgi:hypothetical protein